VVDLPAPPTTLALPPPITTPPPLVSTPLLQQAPSIDTTTPRIAVPQPAPNATIVPGCPNSNADCTPEEEGEGPLSEAAKEILKEFLKCAAEGKSFDQCLVDDPAPTALANLNGDERAQLVNCLGSSDLNGTRDFWEPCIARVR
jgi:hypothetical protein